MTYRNARSLLMALLLGSLIIVSGCDRKPNEPSGETASDVRISASTGGTAVEFDSTNAVVRVVIEGDLFGRIDSTYRLIAGRYFEASLDLPVGEALRVTLTLEEIVSINLSQVPPDTTFRVVYSGSTTAVVSAEPGAFIEVDMTPVVPMVRLSPRFTELPSGDGFQLALEVHNMPNLALIDVVIDFGYFGDELVLPIRGTRGPSLRSSVDFSASLVNDDTEYEVLAVDTTQTGVQSITDANGFAVLAIIHFDSKQLAGIDSRLTSVIPALAQAIDLSNNMIDVNSVANDQADISLLPAPDTIVTFPDPVLRDAVIRAVGSNPPLTLSQVLGVTYVELTSDALEVDDLKNIEVMQNLVEINFLYGTFTDVSPLAMIPSLTRVTLGSGDLVNIAPLANLPNLQYLDLSYNSIVDIAPLVQNQGLGAGDTVDLTGNPLNSDAFQIHIPILEGRGVTVFVGTK